MLPDGFFKSNESKFPKENDKERKETSLRFVYCDPAMRKGKGEHIKVFSVLSNTLYYEVREA